jgi:serine/threonine protein kinase
VSDEAKDVVKQLMCVDVTKRASLNEILCHKWFTSEPNLLDRLQALIRKDHQDFDETILDCLKINESHEKTVTSEVAKRGLERTDSEASEERNGPRSSTLRQRRPVVEAKRQKKC